MIWQKLPRSERAVVGHFECDVWVIGDGARYSILDTKTQRYVNGGKCASLEWAKAVSAGFARSLLQVAQ